MNKEIKKHLKNEEGDMAELEALRRDKSLKENLEAELDILTALFPDLKADDIPDSVFEGCDNGKGLAAQYALYHLQSQKEKEETAMTNEKNSKSAPPQMKGGEEEGYFTPEMVRAMSEKDVRRHYKAIMKSMEKWNTK